MSTTNTSIAPPSGIPVPLEITQAANAVVNQVQTQIDTNTDIVIPAGKLKVYFKNLGASQAGDANSHITVNGQRYEIGQEDVFEIYEDKSTSPFTDRPTPEITIVTNGARVQGYFTE